MPLSRLLAALRSPTPPALATAPLSQHTHTAAALRAAFAVHHDLRALMERTHPHLTVQLRPGFGRCTIAVRPLAAGSAVLRERAFASVRLTEATRGCDGALVDTLSVYAGDGTPAAALPFFLQLEPNLASMQAGRAPEGATSLALMAPALHRNGFVVSEGLQLSVLLAALTNHSCLPNVSAQLLQEQGAARPPEIVFTALRDIAAGEELLVSYTDPSQSLAQRRQRLTATYSFHCTCPKCRQEALEDPSQCTCAECAALEPSSL